jgi:squalene monooxygenase
MYHFFAVAFYSIWVMFTHPRAKLGANGKSMEETVRIEEYGVLVVKSIRVVCRLLLPSVCLKGC